MSTKKEATTTRESAYTPDGKTWKLSEGDVEYIVNLYKEGFSTGQLGKMFRVSRQAILYQLVEHKVKRRNLKDYLKKVPKCLR
jgi:predicted DNA-binding protein YlxM (UPF0122 family)